MTAPQSFGEYVFDGMLGQGGQGVVMRVKDPRIPDKLWALKLFQNKELFEHEKQVLNSLEKTHHPAFPRLGNAFAVNGQFALVTTYFRGTTLRGKQQPWRWVFRFVQDLASILEKVHTTGWLYLDLKPENVIVGSDGRFHLIDYGSSKILSHAVADGLATVGYAAPEQLNKGQVLTVAADMYALGALSYELLMGQTPSIAQTVSLPDIPVSFEQLLRSMLSTKAQSRPKLAQLLLLNIKDFELEILACPQCTKELRKSISQCPYCQYRFVVLTPPSVPHNQVPRILPRTKINPPGNLGQLFSQLSTPNLLRQLETKHLRMSAEEIARERGFEELQAPRRLGHLIQFYEHQLLAAKRALRDMRGNAILADEVGLGKTIEAGLIIEELRLRKLIQSVLIVVPNHLLDQWAGEMKDKFDLAFKVYENLRDWGHPWLVISVNTLSRNRQVFANRNYDLVVVDEMHNLLRKDGSPKVVYEAIASLKRNYTLLLSATTIRRFVHELYHLVHLIRPGHFRALPDFQRRFGSGPKAHNAAELKAALSEVMIRHHRRDPEMAKHLPPPRQIEPRELIAGADEQRLLDITLQAIAQGQLPLNANTLSQVFSSPASLLEIWRRAGRNPPINTTVTCQKIEEVKVILAVVMQTSSSRAIIFTRESSTAIDLADQLQRFGYQVVLFASGLNRQEKIERFHRFKRLDKAVLVSTDIAAEGRNLQFAHHLINFDIPWNPLKLEQRIGRIDRLGQHNTPMIYNLYYANNFEGDVYNLLYNRGLRMFELFIGELVSVLEEIEEFADRTMEQVM